MKNLLPRKIILSLAFCFALMGARGQYVTIPDGFFVNYLYDQFPNCMNGNSQLDTTCVDVINAGAVDCSGYNISDLTGIKYFVNLTFLNCGDNNLTSLPDLPTSLTTIYCDENQLTSLPTFPPSLTFFSCSYNLLTSLPALPVSMPELYCQYNQLYSLPALPASLKVIHCENNNLTWLPSLPDSLNSLQCNDNYLTSLPTLPDSLKILFCYNNQLTSLPAFPDVLGNVVCNDNQLTSLTSLPNSMGYFYVYNNPNLTCLPPIRLIGHFYWSNTGITCLPNSITVGYVSPPINSVPLCAYSNTNNCPVYWSISGKTFTDSNSNCLPDSNELLLQNFKVKLYNGTVLQQQAFSNSMGEYAFTCDTGTYTYSVDTTLLPINIVCPLSSFYTTTVSNVNLQNSNKDFSIECKLGIFDIGVNSIINSSGRFRPNNYATVNILAGDISNHYNLRCATGISGTVTIIISGPASFSSVTPGALTPVVNGDTLIYSIADFGTVNFNTDFSFVVQTDITAQAGDDVCFDVAVAPLAGDNNTANNNYTQCFTVRNSFDPNEKEVYPSGSIDTSQHELTYTIYFQNTGNDTAQFIYVLDTLDNAIDESSIQLLAYSHEPVVQVVGNVVKFNFPNINLPDSTTDEPHSHGYVQYSVRIRDNQIPGTIIQNTANIYFDFNAPIQTNTTFNQIVVPVANAVPKTNSSTISIYPNPIKDFCKLYSASFINADLFLYDITGRELLQQHFNTQADVNLSTLTSGIYIVEIKDKEGRSVKGKVVKE